jgi:chromosome partitioning protein
MAFRNVMATCAINGTGHHDNNRRFLQRWGRQNHDGHSPGGLPADLGADPSEIDGDVIRAATQWAQRGNGDGFPFKVVDETQGIKAARDFVAGRIVIDTEANPSRVDFREVAEGCDLLVIPAVRETTATDGLIYTLKKLREIGSDRYRILICKVRPKPNHDAEKLRADLADADITAVFASEIPNLIAFDKASAAARPSKTCRMRTLLEHGPPTNRPERKLPMAEKSKFGGLAELRNPNKQPSHPEPPAMPARRTRPVGKRSDPDWKQYCHMLRIETLEGATARLRELNESRETKMDISDLLEVLLAQWVKENQ